MIDGQPNKLVQTIHGEYTVRYTVDDYWKLALNHGEFPLESFPDIQAKNPFWNTPDPDLHIYPYTIATPALLSVGCTSQCHFCDTALEFKGKKIEADPEVVIPKYANSNVHFVDPDFFDHSKMDRILELCRENNVKWLAMSTWKNTAQAFKKYGAKYLNECGCVTLEVGLQNVKLMMQVKDDTLDNDYIQMHYLNMTFLPKETKATIQANAEWMKVGKRSLQHPTHQNNGLWYTPGQYYFPYDSKVEKYGVMTQGKVGITAVTFVPNTFLEEKIKIKDLEMTNHYTRMVSRKRMYLKKSEYTVKELMYNDEYPQRTDAEIADWIAIGVRCGGIV